MEEFSTGVVVSLVSERYCDRSKRTFAQKTSDVQYNTRWHIDTKTSQ